MQPSWSLENISLRATEVTSSPKWHHCPRDGRHRVGCSERSRRKNPTPPSFCHHSRCPPFPLCCREAQRVTLKQLQVPDLMPTGKKIPLEPILGNSQGCSAAGVTEVTPGAIVPLDNCPLEPGQDLPMGWTNTNKDKSTLQETSSECSTDMHWFLFPFSTPQR